MFSLAQIQAQLKLPAPEARAQALFQLANRVARHPEDHAVARPLLEHALATETHPWGLTCAARGLETVLGPAAAESTWLAMLRSPDVATVRQAVASLTQPRYLPVLIEVLRSHPDLLVRQRAIHTLGRLKDPVGFEVLVELLPNPRLRPYAVEALGALGDPRAIPVLEPLLQDFADAWPDDNHGPMLRVADVAGQALGRLRSGLGPRPASTAPPPLPPTSAMPPAGRRVDWKPLLPWVPLAAAALEIPWVILLLYSNVARSRPIGRTAAETHQLDLLALLPLAAGFLVGVWQLPRRNRPQGVWTRLVLFLGLTGCLLAAVPFVEELLNR